MPCRARQKQRDSEFDSKERLYRRIPPNKVLDGHPLPQCFNDIPLSVNRSKHSTALCVLCDKIYHFRYAIVGSHVMEVRVSSLPPDLMTITHTPRSHNFAHCDLKPTGAEDEASRKLFRLRLSELSTIVGRLPECENYLAKN